jgi:hypothetical protein
MRAPFLQQADWLVANEIMIKEMGLRLTGFEVLIRPQVEEDVLGDMPQIESDPRHPRSKLSRSRLVCRTQRVLQAETSKG